MNDDHHDNRYEDGEAVHDPVEYWGHPESYWTWVSDDNETAVLLNAEGCWLRKRDHVSDMWGAPELMHPTVGSGTLLVSDLGVTDETNPPPDVVITFPITPQR